MVDIVSEVCGCKSNIQFNTIDEITDLIFQKSSKSLILDVGEDCCILTSSDGKLKLDLDLPEAVNENDTGAQFNRKTKVLSLCYGFYFFKDRFYGIFGRKF